MVDCRGRLLGIATSGLSRIAGLAIPASSVNRVVDALLERGHVPRGYLGIGVQPVAIPDALRTSLSVTGKNRGYGGKASNPAARRTRRAYSWVISCWALGTPSSNRLKNCNRFRTQG